jgi:hypothetical protein
MGDTEAAPRFVDVELSIRPQTATKIDRDIFFEVNFTRARTPFIQPSAAPSDPAPALPERVVIRDTLQCPLSRELKGQITLNDVVNDSKVFVALVGLDGRALQVKEAFDVNANEEGLFRKEILLTDADAKDLSHREKLPEGILSYISRPAAFVQASGAARSLEYSSNQLLVAPMTLSAPEDWKNYGFQGIFEWSKGVETVSGCLSHPIPAQIQGLDWSFARLAVDGSFTARFPPPPKDGWKSWVWLMSGPSLRASILGVVKETLTESKSRVRSLFLPSPMDDCHGHTEAEGDEESVQPPTGCHCANHKRVPATASEAELASNPQVYSEDPGTVCKPFSNPERVVSERSFFSIVRTEQPVISAEATIKLREPAQLDFDPPDEMLQGINGEEADNRNDTPVVMLSSPAPRFLPRGIRINSLNGSTLRERIRSGINVVKDGMPNDLVDELLALNHGRRDLDASFPVQWDSESIRYQATTVARGHILEFRVRTRSNGYSLGGIAKTLDLNPRATKRESSDPVSFRYIS